MDRVAPALSLRNTKYQVEKSRKEQLVWLTWREIKVVNNYYMESKYSSFDQRIYKVGKLIGKVVVALIIADFISTLAVIYI